MMVVMLKKAMTYLVICQLTGTRRIYLQELLPTIFCLVITADFFFFLQVFTCSGFRISFGFMDILLTLYECSTEYLTTQEVGFV